MTDISTLPSGWVFKVEDHEGDPLPRYFLIREPNVDEAAVAVAASVNENLVHVERAASHDEIAGLRPREIRSLGTGQV
jgi:hypothetical protein